MNESEKKNANRISRWNTIESQNTSKTSLSLAKKNIRKTWCVEIRKSAHRRVALHAGELLNNKQ